MPIHLRSLEYQGGNQAIFPFSVPTVRSLGRLDFSTPITFFVGENGSGKSTVLEALAVAAGAIAMGGDDLSADPSLAHARTLARAFRLTWSRKTHRGFFFRAEDFFRFVRRVHQSQQDLRALEAEFEEKYDGYARMLATGAARTQRRSLENRYGADPDARSHGESFIAFLQARMVPNGIYFLDEPETPLSPQRQLALMLLLDEMVGEGCQFVIATHSPILLAHPGACILSFDQVPIRQVGYDELDHVTFTRGFLAAPERFLRHLSGRDSPAPD